MTIHEAMRRIEARIERDQQALAVLREMAGGSEHSRTEVRTEVRTEAPGSEHSSEWAERIQRQFERDTACAGPVGCACDVCRKRAEVAPPRPSRRPSGRPNGHRMPDGQTQQQVLDLLNGEPMSSSAIASTLGISSQAVRLATRALYRQKRIRVLGTGNRTRYVRA